MKQIYRKPNTDIHQIEMSSMIAATTLPNSGGGSDKIDEIINIDSKKNDFSLWGDSNEEE
ncbi:MAG: hypothetical protein IJ549_04525 [Prevotella sp.]|nr:hypothetical protein [Prevotella sp.]